MPPQTKRRRSISYIVKSNPVEQKEDTEDIQWEGFTQEYNDNESAPKPPPEEEDENYNADGEYDATDFMDRGPEFHSYCPRVPKMSRKDHSTRRKSEAEGWIRINEYLRQQVALVLAPNLVGQEILQYSVAFTFETMLLLTKLLIRMALFIPGRKCGQYLVVKQILSTQHLS
ncbi:hypothetical protein BCR33DRAFT_796698 [Rhizoclosmatium globosum]|uniref:Uncharacterized protein n=1 Tax=Rhizoclosmatium globosum TaxID=329046 RepID=A0A1Y2AKH9_9FUNG|nr:hypothetical protein BCR33DRAFT_796698 [Rhizoclosmatium globosum]|eukprot:ORY22992.1 hypothetical protein BCR33DRAFT_796698 [Rhizoclosmatium globosum]